MDLATVRERWIRHNNDLINKFAQLSGANKETTDLVRHFGNDYLIDFESELDEDPENLDGGILTLDTVTASYIDFFLGRWLIQRHEGVTEDLIDKYQQALHQFFSTLKENKLYKERAAQWTKLMNRLENKKKYVKRFREYQKIKDEKDEDTRLDLLQEWEEEEIM